MCGSASCSSLRLSSTGLCPATLVADARVEKCVLPTLEHSLSVGPCLTYLPFSQNVNLLLSLFESTASLTTNFISLKSSLTLSIHLVGCPCLPLLQQLPTIQVTIHSTALCGIWCRPFVAHCQTSWVFFSLLSLFYKCFLLLLYLLASGSILPFYTINCPVHILIILVQIRECVCLQQSQLIKIINYIGSPNGATLA